VIFHLHPELMAAARFSQPLPRLVAGHYQLFADIVHGDGMPETATSELYIGALAGTALGSDDATAEAVPVSAADVTRTASPLAEGGRMIWERPAEPLVAGRLASFTFRVENRAGERVADLEPYLGMLGHALFLSHDRTIFA